MVLDLASRGVTACSPWGKPWKLEPNKAQAPDGSAVTDFWVAGFAKIGEFLRGHLTSGDISYTYRHHFSRYKPFKSVTALPGWGDSK